VHTVDVFHCAQNTTDAIVMCINLNINDLVDIGAERALPMQSLHERSLLKPLFDQAEGFD